MAYPNGINCSYPNLRLALLPMKLKACCVSQIAVKNYSQELSSTGKTISLAETVPEILMFGVDPVHLLGLG